VDSTKTVVIYGLSDIFNPSPALCCCQNPAIWHFFCFWVSRLGIMYDDECCDLADAGMIHGEELDHAHEKELKRLLL